MGKSDFLAREAIGLVDSSAPQKRAESSREDQSAPEWLRDVDHCLRRIGRWRVPPNWSFADWTIEVRSVAIASGAKAAAIYDPAAGTGFSAFIQSRVLAGALAFYRHEWNYVTRHPEGVSLPEEQELVCSNARAPHPRSDSLREALRRLPRDRQNLLEDLFERERSEAEIGRELGLSQRAVSKRKQSALSLLRQFIDQ